MPYEYHISQWNLAGGDLEREFADGSSVLVLAIAAKPDDLATP